MTKVNGDVEDEPSSQVIDVAICTYRRRSLAETIVSVDRQRLPKGFEMSIIVADNDVTPSAQPLVTELANTTGRAIIYRHAPSRNISIARNTALAAGHGDWIACIDDDEIAAKDWLVELMNEAQTSGADVIFGPVEPVYEATAPKWLQLGAFHRISVVSEAGTVKTGYTSNALVRRAAIPTGLQFDQALGRSGGEDTQFFHAMYRAGARLAFAANALVTESIPPERESFTWLMRRRFRSGQSYAGLSSGRRRGWRKTKVVAVASAKALFCALAAVASAWSPVRRRFWVLRGTLQAGVAAGHLGRRPLSIY